MGKYKPADLVKLPSGMKHHDGEGLYFDKKLRGASWLYKFTLNGQAREMGLGKYPDITLAKARDLAARARTKRAEGIDPIAERTAVRRRGLTFEDAATEYWRAHCQILAKPNNWLSGMKLNVFPHIGKKPVVELTPDHLIKFLRPIWGQEKTRKLRQWINAVVGYVSSDDPRADRELIAKVDNRLGPQGIENENHPAVAWGQIPQLYAALPTSTLVGLSMRLLILTGVRVGCVVHADWSEFDLKEGVWTIPAGRVKGWKYVYRVPLTEPMITTLKEAKRRWGNSGLVFPSPKSASGHLSDNSHRMWLHDHAWKDPDGRLATTHGLRSALRTWMHEQRPPIEFRLSEHILQHMGRLGTPTEQAYVRADQLDHRREVLDAWSGFCVASERAEIAQKKAKLALDTVADKDGRTTREVLIWSRDAKEPEHLEGMTTEDKAAWERANRPHE